MASSLGLSEVQAFFETEVWKVMETRLKNRLAVVDSEMEDSEPFKHGRAVGERTAYRLVLRMGEILTSEAKGTAPYEKR